MKELAYNCNETSAVRSVRSALKRKLALAGVREITHRQQRQNGEREMEMEKELKGMEHVGGEMDEEVSIIDRRSDVATLKHTNHFFFSLSLPPPLVRMRRGACRREQTMRWKHALLCKAFLVYA